MQKKAACAVTFDLLLVQCALCGIACFYYGMRPLLLCIIAVCTCFLLDYCSVTLRHFPYRAAHLDCLTTGMTLALLMPASVSYAVLIISCFVAIIIGKALLGGRSNLLFPPAAIGYLFAIFCWKNEVLQYPAPGTTLALLPRIHVPLQNAVSTAYNLNSVVTASPESIWLGKLAGPMGAAPFLLLVVGGLVLLLRRSVSPTVCLGAIGTFLLYAVSIPFPGTNAVAFRNLLLTNLHLFGILFLAGDVRLAPKGLCGVLYGTMLTAVSLLFTLRFSVEYGIVVAVVLLSPACVVLKQQAEKIAKLREARKAEAAMTNANPS